MVLYMAELLQTRTISGKGVLLLDPIVDPKYRYLLLLIDVIRLPFNQYLNNKWNPSEGFFANVTIGKNGYVMQTRAIKYPAELWKIVPDISGQNLLAQKCALDATFQSIINLGTALGVVPISVVNPIAEYTTLSIEGQEFKFVCYSSAALRLRLYGQEYDVCDGEYVRRDTGPELPPPEPGSVPENEPVVTSPPYTGEDDGGDTVPYPGDAPEEEEEFPIGGNCEEVYITGRIDFETPDNQQFGYDFEASVWGEITAAETVQNTDVNIPTEGGFQVTCNGRVEDVCDGPVAILIAVPNANVCVPGSIVITNVVYNVL